MGATFRRLTRTPYFVVALAFLATVSLPVFGNKAFAAYGQVTSRSIELSSSVAGATGVNYLVTFTPSTTGTQIKSMAVDFCSNDPLIGDSCTAPTGFSVGTPTVTGTSITGQSGGSWTATSANSGRTLELSNSGTQTGTPTGAASFTLTTATNPTSTPGSFYARILTFANSGDAATWGAASGGNGSSTALVVDAGGIALSTAQLISITAKVQEQLTFCTSGSTITTCSTTTAPTITLGHNNGSGTFILDSTAIDTALVYSQMSTNASSGVVVRMASSGSPCTNPTATPYTTVAGNGGLSSNSGNTCLIPGAGDGTGHASGNTEVKFAISTPIFGLCVDPNDSQTTAYSPYDNSLGTGGAQCGGQGSVTSGSTSAYFGLDNTSSTGVGSNYGSQVLHSTGPTNQANDEYNFAAGASNTTPAGIYTVKDALIATGTF